MELGRGFEPPTSRPTLDGCSPAEETDAFTSVYLLRFLSYPSIKIRICKARRTASCEAVPIFFKRTTSEKVNGRRGSRSEIDH